MTTTAILESTPPCPLLPLEHALRDDLEHPAPETPQRFSAAGDLCVLAIMAASGELEAPAGADLRPDTLRRLRELEGARPAAWWTDLLHRAEALRLLHRSAGRWAVTSDDAELLGATASECFPALLASWLADPRWADHLPADTLPPAPRRDRLRVEILRALGVFAPEHTYRARTLQLLLRALLLDLDHPLEGAPLEALTRALLERVLAVLGVVELGPDARTFRLRPDLTLPPLSPRLEPLRHAAPSRAERFRLMLEARLRCDDAWTRVAPQLRQVAELRRERQCCTSALTGLSGLQPRIVANPQTPFKDCLFLARYGRLVHDEACPHTPGQFIFEIDLTRLSAPPCPERGGDDLLSFVARRSTDQHLLGRLQQALIERSAHDRDP